MKKHIRPARINRRFYLLVLYTALFLLAGTAGATTIVVTSTDPGTGGNDCTLRDAITAANTSSLVGGCDGTGGPPFVVELGQNAVYTLLESDNEGDYGDNGLPLVTTEITVKGNGAMIQRNPLLPTTDAKKAENTPFRIFQVEEIKGVHKGVLKLENVTLSHGLAEQGGAIYSTGTVEIRNSVFIANNAGCGGGILNQEHAALTVENTLLSFNTAYEWGGGAILSGGSVAVSNCLFSYNHAAEAGALRTWAGSLSMEDSSFLHNSSVRPNNPTTGGGAVLVGGKLAVPIKNCIFVGNTNAMLAGALGVEDGNSVIATNCAFYANQAVNGGALWNSGQTELVNCTLYGNIASGGGSAIYTHGTTTVRNTIIAGSKGAASCSGEVVDGGYNLEDGDSCHLIDAQQSLRNTNPLVSLAGFNRSSTPSFALLPNSPAIDRIPSGVNGCGDDVTTDYRGIPRPKNALCDMGAFESRGFDLRKLSGDHQAAKLLTPFARPLRIQVSSRYGEPVSGGAVTFRGPVQGAGILPAEAEVLVDATGSASFTPSANGRAGTYRVTGAARGSTKSTFFTLINKGGLLGE